jgi:hypothetical protein
MTIGVTNNCSSVQNHKIKNLEITMNNEAETLSWKL